MCYMNGKETQREWDMGAEYSIGDIAKELALRFDFPQPRADGSTADGYGLLSLAWEADGGEIGFGVEIVFS